MISTYRGYQLIESSYLVDRGPDKLIDRTWKERLFSLPWTPFKKTKVVETYVPSDKMYVIGRDKIIIHPEKIKIIKDALIKDVIV